MTVEKDVRVIAMYEKCGYQSQHHVTEESGWICTECGQVRAAYFKSLDFGVTLELKNEKWVAAHY